ncbi:multiheme c-type cytochrome [Microbulbifer yueqingensis]|uniref:Flp pilus assembly protein TadD, contains TPR repeats n=1 Tax=Microbulbifer yueqingensis TaxID=658219 RepID=A0A1G8ZBW0_9GAMM|nr:multiheme c-type cytochrome [Microbulbifer yueqingensis]SDK12569.1 Flp pilus assembly protein TadD, contains TPR repeats [Microbulbifer yueqingensis]
MPVALPVLLVMLLIAGCDRHSGPAQKAPASPGAIKEATAEPPAGSSPATYVGTRTCVGCHAEQFKRWQGSHHDLAMQEANADTVLGDFDNAEFNYYGARSRFFTHNGRYMVRTDGPDGKTADYPIAYTFGVHPLQQYLVALPGGKLQALGIAWDSRKTSEGGQRWFHLHPEEHIEAGDQLHWTGLNYNWNFICADCHSTNLQKNYDPASHTYATSWSEMDVGCEACHGPASRHLQWAANPDRAVTRKGFAVSYRAGQQAAWVMDAAAGTARLSAAAETQTEIETCAQCHSRRRTSFPGARAGSELLDHFSPALLTEPLYHADGQVRDEVYVYGSFLQSKMHAAGVSCSNCHEPHSLQLRAEGNAVCAQCHLPGKFDTAAHHFHPRGSEGAQCVNCHMPAKTYMQVDARRDHSLRVPRPDLSERLQTPNACTGCHTDQSNRWAARVLAEKFGPPTETHFGETLYAGRHGLPGAERALMALAVDDTQPAIARATAVSLLPRYLSRQSAQLLQAIAQGNEPLLNLGLAQSLESVPAPIRPALAIPLLYEGKRVTESLAANALAAHPVEQLPARVQQQYSRALASYRESERFNSDRPESLANLAGIHAQWGDQRQAELLYRQAISLAPYFTPAYVNLADLYRSSGRESDAESLLREALDRVPQKAPVQHALGLSLVRQGQRGAAIELLRQSATAEAAPARYIYVYAVALNSAGRPEEAIAELERGLEHYPADRQILSALVAMHREAGDETAARKYLRALQ